MAVTIKQAHGFDLANSLPGWQSGGGRVDQEAITRGQGAALYHWGQGGGWSVSSFPGADYDDTFSADLKQGFLRWYVYIEAYPDAASGDGMIGLCYWRNTIEAAHSAALTIDSTGKLRLYNLGQLAAPELLAVGPSLNLFQWYCLEMSVLQNTTTDQPAPNPPYQSNAAVYVKVDGALVMSVERSGADVDDDTGIDYYASGASISQAAVGAGKASGATDVGTATTGFIVHVDDVVFCEGGWIGFGSVVEVTPTGIGTTEGWGASAANDQLTCKEYPDNSSDAYYASASALDEVTFACPTLRSLGITSATRFVNVKILSSLYQFAGEAVLVVNGTTYRETAYGGLGGYWGGAKFNVAIGPDDTVEIGWRKDNSADAKRVSRVLMLVEAERYTLPVTGAHTVQIASGTYTGNGTQQEISVGFRPDVVIVSDVLGLAQPSVMARDKNGYVDTPWQFGSGEASGIARTMIRFTSDGFVVSGSAALNANTATYSVIAIKDAYHRVFARRYALNYSGMADERVYFYKDAAFTALQLFLHGSTVASSVLLQIQKGPGHAANKASFGRTVDPHDVADVVSEIAPGSFVLQPDAYGTFSRFNVLAVQEHFNSTTTQNVGVFTYTGNGAGAVDVNLPSQFSLRLPVAAIVTAVQTPSGIGYYYKGPGFAAGKAVRMTGTGLDSDVLDFAVGKIQIGTTGGLNDAGVAYNVVVLFEGTDTIPRTTLEVEDEPGPEGSGPGPCNASWGCDWSYTRDEWSFDWPDAVPGLLGVRFGVRRFNAPPIPKDERTYNVNCEQRTFPVDLEEREFSVPCDQREFDALAEFP